MKTYRFALALLAGSLLVGNSYGQKYSFSVINTGLQQPTIQRPYAINDSGTILLQPYSGPANFNNSLICLLINGSNIQQTQQYPGSDQYFSLSNNGYIAGIGIYGNYFVDDVSYNLVQIPTVGPDKCYPTGINSSQTVVGMGNSATSGQYAYIYQNGILSNYVFPGSTSCTLNGINDGGDLVGTYFVGKLHKRFYGFAVLGGHPIQIAVPGCFDPNPSAISSNDIIVGTAISDRSHLKVGFVRYKNGKVAIIDYKPQAPFTIPAPSGTAGLLDTYSTEVFGVNASGVLVGTFTGTYQNADGTWAQTNSIPFMATPR